MKTLLLLLLLVAGSYGWAIIRHTRPPAFFNENSCPVGSFMGSDGNCIPKRSFVSDSFNQDRCPPGQIFVGGRCVGRPNSFFIPPCPLEEIYIGGVCKKKPFPNSIGSRCPINHSVYEGKCIECNPPKNPCPEGEILDCGCTPVPLPRHFLGTCTTSLECPDNRKCVDGVCLAV